MKIPLEFTINLALQVGYTLRDLFISGGRNPKIKSDASLVTEFDLMADELITKSIKAEFPKDIILSEELNTVLQDAGEAIWVVDPLDGTTNFILGIQYWGISIARLAEGQPQCASIYFPMLNELYSSERGQGAFLNGKQIQTVPPKRDQPAAFFSCCSRTYRLYNVSVPYKARIFGSAAFSFCSVARGTAVLGFEATPKIWDIAAGWLIASEAGGAVETLDSQKVFPLSIGVDYSHRNYPTLIAAATGMLPKARTQILPKENA